MQTCRDSGQASGLLRSERPFGNGIHALFGNWLAEQSSTHLGPDLVADEAIGDACTFPSEDDMRSYASNVSSQGNLQRRSCISTGTSSHRS